MLLAGGETIKAGSGSALVGERTTGYALEGQPGNHMSMSFSI